MFPGQFSVAHDVPGNSIAYQPYDPWQGLHLTEPVLLFVGCCAYVFNMARTFGVCRPAGVHPKNNLFL